jgi:hypothetical protein
MERWAILLLAPEADPDVWNRCSTRLRSRRSGGVEDLWRIW